MMSSDFCVFHRIQRLLALFEACSVTAVTLVSDTAAAGWSVSGGVGRVRPLAVGEGDEIHRNKLVTATQSGPFVKLLKVTLCVSVTGGEHH